MSEPAGDRQKPQQTEKRKCGHFKGQSSGVDKVEELKDKLKKI
jgi:hypothetical protein